MKKIISILTLIVCLGVSLQSNAQCADRPIVNNFSPKTGFIGSTVTITGANFSATPGNKWLPVIIKAYQPSWMVGPWMLLVSVFNDTAGTRVPTVVCRGPATDKSKFCAMHGW